MHQSSFSSRDNPVNQREATFRQNPNRTPFPHPRMEPCNLIKIPTCYLTGPGRKSGSFST